MIKEYDLRFYGPSASTTNQELYEKYVDQIYQIVVDCGLFTSVVKNKPAELPETDPYTAYSVEAYIDEDKVLQFELAGNVTLSGNNKMLPYTRIRAYYSHGVYSVSCKPTTQGITSWLHMGLSHAYVTSNGVFFKMGMYYSGSGGITRYGNSGILIAKSNKRCPMIVIPGEVGTVSKESNERSTDLRCHMYYIISVNYDDESYLMSADSQYQADEKQYNYSTTAKQTMLFPFIAYGDVNYDYSYSKYACWMPYAPDTIRSGGFQKVLINGKAYVIDGYFALRDD